MLSSRLANHHSQSTLASPPSSASSSRVSLLLQQDEGVFSSTHIVRLLISLSRQTTRLLPGHWYALYLRQGWENKGIARSTWRSFRPSTIPTSSQRLGPASVGRLDPHDRALIHHIRHPDAHFRCACVVQPSRRVSSHTLLSRNPGVASQVSGLG